MCNKICAAAMFIMATMPCMAQYSVKGVVADSTGVAESFATIRIFNSESKDKPSEVGTTDVDGKFKMNLSKAGNYMLTVTSVGKSPLSRDFSVGADKPAVNLDTLVVRDNATLLKGVEVTAQKPLVKAEIDRLSYDVQSDADSKTNNVLEMLKKVPMVTVDGQENIKVKGSGNFKIYRNGRPDNIISTNPKEALRSIPASMIKKIEVITEPGAKYDAEGVDGILNIVTMESMQIKGVMGNLSLMYSTLGRYNANMFTTTQIGKLTTTLNYGYYYQTHNGSENFQNIEYNYLESGRKLDTDFRVTAGGYTHYGNISSSLDITPKDLLTFSFGGYYYNVRPRGSGAIQMFDRDDNSIYCYDERYNSPKYSYYDFNGRLDYQHTTKNEGETLVFSYLISTTNQSRDEEHYYSNPTGLVPMAYTQYVSDGNLKFCEHTFQLDWTRPIAERHKLEFGAKYIYRNNDSQTYIDYTKDETTIAESNTHFKHLTQVAAAYGEYAYNYKNFGARAGLRYEYSYLSAKYLLGDNPNFTKSLSDFVPTLSLSYNINQQNNLKLNYATRVNRPGIVYLNPAVQRTPSQVSTGNPELGSTRNHSISLTYSLMKPKFMFVPSLSFSFSNNSIADIQYVNDNIIYNTYDNIGRTRGGVLSAYMQWQIGKTTSINFNGNVSYNKMSNKDLNLSLDRWSFTMYPNINQQLPWKINANLGLYHIGGSLSSVYSYTSGVWMYYAGLSRSFLKEDRLSVKINFQRGINSRYWSLNTYTVNGDLRGVSGIRLSLGQAMITVAYRFGNLKAQVKKTAATINNDDLSGRNNK